MKMLQDYTFVMDHNDVTIRLPEPEAYILHKILISPKRKDTAKRKRI